MDDKKQPIRVLHIVGNMNPGGMETFAMNLYRNIDRSKIQFDFVVSSPKESFYEKEINKLGGFVYRCTPMTKNLFKHMFRLSKLIKENNYMVMHRHTSSAVIVFDVIVAKILGVRKIIVHSHAAVNSGRNLFLHRCTKWLLNLFTIERFACSQSAGKWLYGKKGFQIINNGISAEKYVFYKEIRSKIRDELKISNKFVIGHIGRFSDVKNHSFLLEVFKVIHDKNENAVLMLIGDGPLKNQIMRKAKTLGLKNQVIFTGVRSDIPDLVCAMDVFVLPSKVESLGIVVIEAQAAGLTCIVSEGIPPEAFITELIEQLSLKEGVECWANKIMSYDNGCERRNMYDKIVDSGYDMKNIAKQMERFYIDDTE